MVEMRELDPGMARERLEQLRAHRRECCAGHCDAVDEIREIEFLLEEPVAER